VHTTPVIYVLVVDCNDLVVIEFLLVAQLVGDSFEAQVLLATSCLSTATRSMTTVHVRDVDDDLGAFGSISDVGLLVRALFFLQSGVGAAIDVMMIKQLCKAIDGIVLGIENLLLSG
jgi:hypothetical protein